MAAKIDWIVLIPDHEGALEKRMAARPSVASIPQVDLAGSQRELKLTE
jgi:hypothetical protein